MRVGVLTERERQVLEAKGPGRTDLEVASQLRIEIGTVKAHLRSARLKLGVPTTLAAVLKAQRQGQI